jgi:hypothetical protein
LKVCDYNYLAGENISIMKNLNFEKSEDLVMDSEALENSPKYTLENFPKLRINLFFTILAFSLSIILSFSSIGYFLDYILNSKPLFLIIFAIISFPVLQVVLYRYVKKL